MTLAQRAVLLFQRVDTGEQFFDPLFEARELQVELCFCCICIVHEKDYEAALFIGSMTVHRRASATGPLVPLVTGIVATSGIIPCLMHTASYAEIQRVLADERSMTDAAEAHGTLAGALCTASTYRFEDWLQEILPEGRAQPVSTGALRGLYFLTTETLAAAEMSFEPLLPEDAQPLDERAAALSQWCVGFLYGLGSGAIQDLSKLPGEVGEVVRDFDELRRVGVGWGGSDDESEGG